MKITVAFRNFANSSKNQQFAHTKHELLVFNNDKKQIILHGRNYVEKNVRVFVRYAMDTKQTVD
jgi:hypothetical protein